MSVDSADFVANTGDTIVFKFTPQANGFAFWSGASLTEEGSGAFTKLNVVANSATFKLPKDDSFVQVAIVDGPVPEIGSLSFTVNGGASTDLWTNRPLFRMPGAFFGFGK